MGPLSGIRVLEFEAIGPGPFAGMLLADMGADVLVVDRPTAGEGMLLGFGNACSLLEAQRSGRGRAVDAAMVEGAALLAAMFAGFLATNNWSEQRASNLLDTGAPWYDVYETKDGKYVAIGA